MKNLRIQILLGLLGISLARADTPLTITTFPALESCLYNNINLYVTPPAATGSFTLNGVSGTGVVQSEASGFSPPPPNAPNTLTLFNYTIDLSGMSSSANHCVKLAIHFGTPDGCNGPAVAVAAGQIQSATLSSLGNITFVFNGGCLQPGQSAISFGMLSDAGYKTNVVTIIDDYTNPSNGLTNESVFTIPAIVPDVAPSIPSWAYAPPLFQTIQYQGAIYYVCNAVPYKPINGALDFNLQLLDAPSNGLALSTMTTQTVQIANGLLNLPLPFDPASYGGAAPSYLSIGVRPSGMSTNPFTPLKNPGPVGNPTPQALFADSAGTVADLMPGQALTSLNGLNGALILVCNTGLTLSTSGNTMTISAEGTSDRNLKTDIVPVNPQSVLARLTAMPIESWRFTNDMAGVQHVGPMAQDFKAAFGLGDSDKTIHYLDASGVALAAVQGLDQKMAEGFQRQDARDVQLEQQIQATKQLLNQINQKLTGGDK